MRKLRDKRKKQYLSKKTFESGGPIINSNPEAEKREMMARSRNVITKNQIDDIIGYGTCLP